jgi:exodeoxyribonuclease VIII
MGRNKMNIQQMTQEEYRAVDALSNSELQLIARSPSEIEWSRNAPVDNTKTAAFDFGTALHAALLEPETFNDSVLVYTDTKSRETVKFKAFYDAHMSEGKLILLEDEYSKIRFQVDSAYAHPTFAKIMRDAEHLEASIFTDLDGIAVKIRPDLITNSYALCDVKTTSSIDDWRNSAKWKNPLFTHGYGHTAAFYMDVLSEASDMQVDSYTFLVVQKTISLGKYPVAVITITREECERYGFFDDVYANLARYKQCKADDNWIGYESFPAFPVFESEQISISEVD